MARQLTKKVHRLTPDLRARFDQLLIAWPILVRGMARKRADRVSCAAAPADWKRTNLDLEQKHGRGHYDLRRRLLHESVEILDRQGKDLLKVFKVLAAARVVWGQERFRQNLIDDRRESFEERQRILRDLYDATGRLRRWIEKLPYLAPGPVMAILDRLEVFKGAMRANPLLTMPASGLLRRARRGRPALLCRDRIERALRRIGIQTALHKDLLTAIGIIPPQG